MINLKVIRILEQSANLLIVGGVSFILLLATLFQFFYHELPCPLCLLQRAGFIGIGVGLLMNLRFGFRPSHYGIALLSGLFTAFVALRQIALHVLPGTGAYGEAILGLHLYTWSFLMAMAIVVSIIIIMSIDTQYETKKIMKSKHASMLNIFIVFFATLIFVNMVGVFLECGLGMCPDNPTSYILL